MTYGNCFMLKTGCELGWGLDKTGPTRLFIVVFLYSSLPATVSLRVSAIQGDQRSKNLAIPEANESKSSGKADRIPTHGFQSLGHSLMIPGVQKGGTTTLRSLLSQIGGCGPQEREIHYFAYMKWAVMSVPPDDLSSNYDSFFKHCEHTQTQKEVGFFSFEKSPASYMKPWIPMRIREVYPAQKVALVLRNPTARAYSGFWNSERHISPEVHGHARGKHIPYDENLFNELVHFEIAIVEACGMPAGNGIFDHDWPLAVTFSACCNAVATKHGFASWPGCKAYGHEQPEQVHNVTASLQNLPRPRTSEAWSGGAFGDYPFDFVRQGIYVHHLRSWYTHLPTNNILLISSDTLFQDPGGVLRLLVRHATSSIVDAQTEAKIQEASKDMPKLNSKTTQHEGMSNDTRRLLDRFYLPFNEQLKTQYGVSV